MTPLEILTQARALISDENHWCQGSYAKNRWWREVDVKDDKAVRFCSFGAMYRVTDMREWGIGNADRAETFLRRAAERLSDGYSPIYVNDYRDHVTVMQMYDMAIEMAQLEQKEAQAAVGSD